MSVVTLFYIAKVIIDLYLEEKVRETWILSTKSIRRKIHVSHQVSTLHSDEDEGFYGYFGTQVHWQHSQITWDSRLHCFWQRYEVCGQILGQFANSFRDYIELQYYISPSDRWTD